MHDDQGSIVTCLICAAAAKRKMVRKNCYFLEKCKKSLAADQKNRKIWSIRCERPCWDFVLLWKSNSLLWLAGCQLLSKISWTEAPQASSVNQWWINHSLQHRFCTDDSSAAPSVKNLRVEECVATDQVRLNFWQRRFHPPASSPTDPAHCRGLWEWKAGSSGHAASAAQGAEGAAQGPGSDLKTGVGRECFFSPCQHHTHRQVH